MKIVSYNIRSSNDPNGHSFAERAPRLKASIEKYDPDIIGLQEVVPSWMEFIPNDYGEKYEIYHMYRDTSTDIEGCTILWRKGMFECLDRGVFWYSDTPEIPSRGWCSWGHYRFCLWVKLKNLQDGKEFFFFDTHFGFSDQCHIDSVRLIRDHIKYLGAEAAIVVGDFNMNQNGPGYRDITKFMVDVNKATANDISITCHGYNAARTGLPIDFVFATPNTVKPVDYHKMDETYEEKFPSDHYGLYAEVEILHRLHVVEINAATSSEETEQQAFERMSRLANTINAISTGDRLVIVQNAPECLTEKMTRRNYDTANGIFWKKRYYSLEQKTDNAVVLKNLLDGKLLCVANGAAPVEGMPAVVGVTEALFGGEEYQALREGGTDVRRAVAPRNLTPTFHGQAADLVAPALESHLFTFGEAVKPVGYRTLELQSRGNYDGDRHAVVAELILD